MLHEETDVDRGRNGNGRSGGQTAEIISIGNALQRETARDTELPNTNCCVKLRLTPRPVSTYYVPSIERDDGRIFAEKLPEKQAARFTRSP